MEQEEKERIKILIGGALTQGQERNVEFVTEKGKVVNPETRGAIKREEQLLNAMEWHILNVNIKSVGRVEYTNSWVAR